ncbi:MAG: hypothetical protein QNJ09_16360 [Paracoccaceae bacterium]|nr:hypothetical protein [Paracoccaceae bacterium]
MTGQPRGRDRQGTPVFVDKGNRATALETVDVQQSESWLQTIIHDHPEVLPIREIDPGFSELVSVAREVRVPFEDGRSGYIDNFLVSGRGQIVLVEVKLWRNPDARRQVVAQALDYAAGLFNLSYSDLDAAVRTANKTDVPIYDMVARATEDVLDEASFVDAVSRNLWQGRVMILVAGDGIREHAESIADLLQGHAGHRFAFAMVEMKPFVLPGAGHVVVPRILLKTKLVERGVVRLEHAGEHVRLAVDPPATDATAQPSGGRTISEDAFFEAIEAERPGMAKHLEDFLKEVAKLGVYPEMLRTLNLKVPVQDSRDLNLGYIKTNLIVEFGPSTWFRRQDVGARYCKAVAEIIGGTVQATRDYQDVKEYGVRQADGTSMPRLWQLLPEHADAWLDAIAEYIKAVDLPDT